MRKRAKTLAEQRPDTPAPAEARGKLVPAALNAVRALQYLSSQSAPVPLVQIARDLKLYPSTCYHLLHTMAREDFITYEPETKAYSLGYGVVGLSHSVPALGIDATKVSPMLQRVAQRHDVTVSLARRVSRTKRVLLLAATGPGNVHVHMRLGQRPPLLSGASGRVMAAHLNLDVSEMESLFQDIQWDKPLSFRKYLSQVHETQARGWSLDHGFMTTGFASIAVPVFNKQDQFAMVCTGNMLIGRYDNKFAAQLAADLTDLAKRVGARVVA